MALIYGVYISVISNYYKKNFEISTLKKVASKHSKHYLRG